MLAQQIISFFEEYVCPIVLPPVKETQFPINPPIAISISKVDWTVGTDTFFYSLLYPVMTSNEHEILIKILK